MTAPNYQHSGACRDAYREYARKRSARLLADMRLTDLQDVTLHPSVKLSDVALMGRCDD